MGNYNTDYDEMIFSESEFLSIKLEDIIDVDAVQSMMDDFFELTKIGLGIVDLNGKVLVATGWQDICTQFHRVNPKSCQHCLESDTILSGNTKINTYKTYKCRNNMWDMSTPVIIGNRHMGNLFLGQFFYDDEEIDTDIFKKQAHKYDFDEKEYLEALHRVPRFSRNKLEVVMRFYTKFAQQISNLGYKNLEHKYSEKKQEILLNSIEESEKKYRKLFNTMFEGIVYQNAEGTIIEANPAAEEILGLSQDQLLGRTSIDPRWKSIRQDGSDFPGNEHPSIVSLQTGKQVHNVIMGIFHPDKNCNRWIVIDAVPEFRENESRPFQVYTSFRDITEYKELEFKLNEKIEELDRYFNSSLDLLCIASISGEFIRLNPEWEKVLGYLLSEMEGKPFLDFVHPDDINATMEVSSRLKNQEEVLSFKNRYRCKNGSYKWIEWRSKPLGDKLYAVAHDITEKKLTEEALSKSEEKYRLIANNTSDGIFVLSAENIITYVSPSYMKLMGLDADAHLGADSVFIYELIHHEDRDALFKMIYEAISKNVSELKYEYRVKHARGHYFWREDNARFVYDEKGNYKGTYVVCRDITERKSAEEKLKTNETKLRELNITKDKLFSIIAHDLRSPFSSIINLSDMLMQAISAKESFDELSLYAENLSYSSKRAYELLVNLLEWSRSQTGQIQFSPYILGLKSEVAESMELYKDVAIQKSIFFEHSIPSRTLVYADKAMLQTILRNLISNAIKFTMPGGSVLIYAESTINEVVVSVKDTGIGMEKEMTKELFILGKDIGRPGTNDEPSTGLGLILCHDFIEKHGGKIWVESEEGIGSTFKFSIPVSPDRKV
ncbi:MAG: PAS domain S-box protein [Bacteroidetes bacterium]|nr:PAS domain S-box protein [Bacteroidota bacterium]